MKKLLTLLLLTAGTVLLSCKKSTVSRNCNSTAGFAGRYKITKKEFVYTDSAVVTDQTATLTACDLSGVYDFNSNGTVTFTESDICAGSCQGTWSISDSVFLVNFPSCDGGKIKLTHIESWNCTNLVATTLYPGPVGNHRYTLTRQ